MHSTATAGDCGPEPGLLEPPVTMLLAVDEEHRHAVVVLVEQVLAAVDVDPLEDETEFELESTQRSLGVLAEMTVSPRDERDGRVERPTRSRS